MPVTDNISLLIFLATGLVIPFAVDLVTNKLASGALKQSVLLGLAIVTGVLGEFIVAHNGNNTFDWTTAGYGAFYAFISGVAVYKGLDKTKALGRDSIISNLLPGGIGAAITPELPETGRHHA